MPAKKSPLQQLADRKITLTDADLEAIVSEELGVTDDGRAFGLESLAVAGGTHLAPTARRRLHRRSGQSRTA